MTESKFDYDVFRISVTLPYLVFIEHLECLGKFGKFLAIIFSNIFFYPFPVLLGHPLCVVGTFGNVSLVSQVLFIFLHSLFFLFLRLKKSQLVYLQVC